MLDWELAHVGDPVEDLGNFAHRLYRGKLKIPSGLLTVQELLAAYARGLRLEGPRASADVLAGIQRRALGGLVPRRGAPVHRRGDS